MQARRFVELLICLSAVAVTMVLLRPEALEPSQPPTEQTQAQQELQASFEKALKTGKEVALSAPAAALEYAAYGMSGEDHRRFNALCSEMDELDEEYERLAEGPESAETDARLSEILTRMTEVSDEMLRLLR